MKLEYEILNYLNDNDNGKIIDVTFICDNYQELKEMLGQLNGRNLIVWEQDNFRDFEAFGISNTRLKPLKAKINTNGKIRLHALSELVNEQKKERKKVWKLSYLFNF